MRAWASPLYLRIGYLLCYMLSRLLYVIVVDVSTRCTAQPERAPHLSNTRPVSQCTHTHTNTVIIMVLSSDKVDISGILDRDQRTVRCRRHPSTRAASPHECTSEVNTNECRNTTSQTNSQRSSATTRKSRTTWRIAQRLKRVLVLSVYLLSIEYVPRALSAPTQSRSMAERMNQHPKWINPCGAIGQGDMVHDAPDAVVVSDRELLEQIVLTASIALDYAKTFRDDYVQKTFSMDFKTHHQLWKAQSFPWLPSRDQIPKELGEVTPSKHLESLELDKALLDTYEYLQTIAVGLEQLVWDQSDDEAPFLSKFENSEARLNALLCEIQVALLERRVTQRPDVRRDIMYETYRNSSNMSARYLRDWLIFRDFMNALEYTVEVFKFLEEKL